MEKSPIRWYKYEYQFPRFFHTIGFVAVSCTMGNWWGNPCISHMMKYTIGWESFGKKITHTMGKVWVPISQVHSIQLVLLHFPVLCEIDGETHAFPTCWSISYDGDPIGRKHSYYGKSMSINFPDFPHTIGFVAFSRTVRIWWENPCIFHMMAMVNFFLCIL